METIHMAMKIQFQLKTRKLDSIRITLDRVGFCLVCTEHMEVAIFQDKYCVILS